MARVSIYVPDEMKSRMDEHETAVNWSSVAQVAFDEEIKKRSWKKGADMDTVVERLRASKLEFEKEQAEGGYDEGVQWAKEHASYPQLMKLAEMDHDDGFEQYEGELAQALDSALEYESPDSIFDSYIERGSYPSDEYAKAFIQGALEVWKAVLLKI